MMPIHVLTLGELQIEHHGEPVALPPSRRTRALLAYLILNPGAHRRERLCELLWWMPNDPRAALRWSLSKIRPVLNTPKHERLIADRERVALDAADFKIDRTAIQSKLEALDLSILELDAIAGQLNSTFLDGIDVTDQAQFQEWLTAEREATRQLHTRALALLAVHPELPLDRLLTQARAWAEAAPFSPDAAKHLVLTLERFDLASDTQAMRQEFSQRFKKAGIQWDPQTHSTVATLNADGLVPAASRELRLRQKIQFCTADDDVRIAYATVGEGPPLIKAANWLSHLELDWDAPIWSPLFHQLAQSHRLIRYDERGNGLSDWDVDAISLDAFVKDLETVVEAVAEQRFALLGISQGAAVSIAYAALHPERVSHLIIFGGYPAGWRIDASEAVIQEREAILTLTGSGWGQDNPAYRQIFSSTFMPSATPQELSWFNEFQRNTTSPENAVRFLSAFGDIDVRDLLPNISVPTLIIHSMGDQRIPLQTGLDMAAAIPNAQFVGLESDNHLLLGREAASDTFVNAIQDFICD